MLTHTSLAPAATECRFSQSFGKPGFEKPEFRIVVHPFHYLIWILLRSKFFVTHSYILFPSRKTGHRHLVASGASASMMDVSQTAGSFLWCCLLRRILRPTLHAHNNRNKIKNSYLRHHPMHRTALRIRVSESLSESPCQAI